jgi:hypothetical protein
MLEDRPERIDGVRITDLVAIVEIDNALAAWRRALPNHLRTDDANPDREATPMHSRQAFSLHSRYLHLRVLLFRPVTVELADGQFFQADVAGRITDFQRTTLLGCIRSCADSAQELIHLIHTGLHTGVHLPWWYAVFCMSPLEYGDERGLLLTSVVTDLYTAGTVVLAVLLTPQLRQAYSNDPESLKMAWSQCVASLTAYKQSDSSFAKRCLWILQTVYMQHSSHGGVDTNGKSICDGIFQEPVLIACSE